MQKRFVILYFCQLVFSLVNAQTLIVDSCKVCKEDSTFHVSPRFDLNDTPCSIVKFITKNISGKLMFKGNIVGSILECKSSYTVYVLNKTKRLKIYHADYIPKTIDFSEYEDSRNGLLNNNVYYVYLSVPNTPQKEETSASVGSRILSFTSNKIMKELTVDGLAWEITNGISSKRLVSYGIHTYEAISKDGSHINGTVNLVQEIGAKNINIIFD